VLDVNAQPISLPAANQPYAVVATIGLVNPGTYLIGGQVFLTSNLNAENADCEISTSVNGADSVGVFPAYGALPVPAKSTSTTAYPEYVLTLSGWTTITSSATLSLLCDSEANPSELSAYAIFYAQPVTLLAQRAIPKPIVR
jgi:hypothetical protein